MNIKEAKEEVIRTVKAYLLRDETGEYVIPVERQRPLLLIGPPGIGKTAIMEQAARECGINLVSYTITHHTRQSAVGLPKLSEKEYGGRTVSVTEYTMSEIIASVYDQIERSHVQEGILFLDEINCVSETLAPTMLQFLQYKTFGPHKVPDGFIIVTAGNPPQYNRSVRDFDIVTLDRVRKIEIEEDYEAWKEYAYRIGIHGAVLAYLEIKKENFYSIRQEIGERRFVTARGWEDLSRMLQVSETLDLPVGAEQIVQFLQDPEIARDFADYYELYHRYQALYRIPEILEGDFPEEEGSALRHAPFDEKLSFISLMIDALGQDFRTYAQELDVQKKVFAMLKEAGAKSGETNEFTDSVNSVLTQEQAVLQQQKTAGMLSREEEQTTARALMAVRSARPESYAAAQNWFRERELARKEQIRKTDLHLTNAFKYLDRVFGEGQEMVIFLSELSAGYFSLRFVNECGNEAYLHYNQLLLLQDRREELRREILEEMEL
ncbi:MAG: AAA family ATPase [Lachnospiraceae bacterium]|nr:AAA family ATPase [Lachnospiraceae bacterium]